MRITLASLGGAYDGTTGYYVTDDATPGFPSSITRFTEGDTEQNNPLLRACKERLSPDAELKLTPQGSGLKAEFIFPRGRGLTTDPEPFDFPEPETSQASN